MELTTEQLEQLVTDAARNGAEAAVRAVNTVDPAARPGGGANVILKKAVKPSISKAVRAAMNGSWSGAELERDFSQATRSITKWEEDNPGAIYWPTSQDEALRVVEQANIPVGSPMAAVRDMAESSVSVSYGAVGGGGALTAPQYLPEEFVFSLQPGVIFRNLPGVDVIPVNMQTIILPRESVKATFSMAAEAGLLSAADPTFASQSLIIKKGYVYRQYSNELLADANPALDRYLTQTVARDMALGWDLQHLEGTGAGNNTYGILKYSGITTATDLNGVTPKADDFYDLVYNLRAANVEPNAWVMHPRTLNTVAKLKDSTGRYLFNDNALNPPILLPGAGTPFTYPAYPVGRLLGLPVYLSGQISITTANTGATRSDTSWVGLGNFNFARILERQGVEIMISPHILFTYDQTAIRATARAALALTQPTAFTVLTGVAP